MAKLRVVLTGAAGYLSHRMFSEFQQRYDLVPTDIRDTFRDGSKVPGVKLCDLTAADRAQIRALFRGADCVVHNGFVEMTRQREILERVLLWIERLHPAADAADPPAANGRPPAEAAWTSA